MSARSMSVDLQRKECKEWWRLYVISIGLTLVLAPQYCLASLQTSIGVKDALGPYSVLIYSLTSVFSLLVYVPLSARIGRSKCLIIGEISSVIYTIALMHPNISTMTVAAALMGIGESVLLPAAGAIVSSFSDDENDETSRKNSLGIYLTTLGLGQVIANIVPKFVLRDSRTQWNTTLLHVKGAVDVSTCGRDDCPLEYAFNEDANAFGQLIPTYKSLLLFLVLFTILQTVGTFLHCFVFRNDGALRSSNKEQFQELLPNQPSVNNQGDLKTVFSNLVTHLKSRSRLMLIPIQMQNSLFNAFLWSEATRSYFSCPFGVEHLGTYLTITYFTSFIFNAAYSKFSSSLPPPVLYVLTYLLETATYVFAYVWEPHPQALNAPVFFSVLLGGTHATRRVVSFVTASVYFDDLDSSYVVHTGALSIGNAMVYAASSLVCVYVKIYVLASLSLLSTILALFAHFHYWYDGEMRIPQCRCKQ